MKLEGKLEIENFKSTEPPSEILLSGCFRFFKGRRQQTLLGTSGRGWYSSYEHPLGYILQSKQRYFKLSDIDAGALESFVEKLERVATQRNSPFREYHNASNEPVDGGKLQDFNGFERGKFHLQK